MSHRIHFLNCPSCGTKGAIYRRGGSRRFRHRDRETKVNDDRYGLNRPKMWHCTAEGCIAEYDSKQFIYKK